MIYARPSSKNLFHIVGGRDLLLGGLILAGLWGMLVYHLHVEWEVNPQYGYGWAVPFLCLFLVARNLNPPFPRSAPAPGLVIPFRTGLILLALLFAPVWLIEQANPEWRLVSWLLALLVAGFTLGLVYLVRGSPALKAMAFPVLYFLVAIPWPTFLEVPVIQGLTRADAQATVELLSWLGVPAEPHGNVIEVVTGKVGIDEACSGIRSFQATLMISLFLGALYHLPWRHRLALVLGGFAMSFFFNLTRMSILVWVAAHQGIAAIARWHDPTGIAILLACFLALWILSVLLAPRPARPPGSHRPNLRQIRARLPG